MLSATTRIIKKDIVKVFSLNAIAAIIRMLTGFVSVKVVAVLIGPAGIALLGQLNNFAAIFLTISTGGINNGITKYIAENKNEHDTMAIYLRTALWITAILSITSGLVLIIGASYFSKIILEDVQYTSIIVVFGCTIILFSFNGLFLSILNGFKEFKKYATINTVSSLVGLLFSCVLAVFFGIYGALLAAVTSQSVVFVITLILVLKCPWFRKNYFFGKFDKSASKRLGNYSIMALVSAATIPVSQLIVRGFISEHVSLSDAGLWEGMNRISAMYLMVVTTSLGVYYLPRLAEINNKNELKNEIISTYKIILPSLFAASVLIFLFRNLIIQLLFNDKFQGMENLFPFQLAGDFFRISSLILSYQMIAKSMTRTYVISEIFFSLLFVVLATGFIRIYGPVGATLGYAINYLFYYLTVLVIFRKILLTPTNA